MSVANFIIRFERKPVKRSKNVIFDLIKYIVVGEPRLFVQITYI